MKHRRLRSLLLGFGVLLHITVTSVAYEASALGYLSLRPEDFIAVKTKAEVLPTQTPQGPINLFGKPAGVEVNAEAQVIELDPLEAAVLVSSQTSYGNVSFGNVQIAPEGLPVPEGIQLKPPCETGLEFYQTGHGFVWYPNWRQSGYHPGVDGRCRISGTPDPLDPAFAVATSKSLVLKVYENLLISQWDSVDLWSSGHTYITVSTISGRKIFGVYGHLRFPQLGETWPQAGDTVESGQALGVIDATGKAYGKHLHLGFFEELLNGSLVWLNPTELNVLGIR